LYRRYIEDRIFAREVQRARRLKSYAVTLRRLAAVPEVAAHEPSAQRIARAGLGHGSRCFAVETPVDETAGMVHVTNLTPGSANARRE
jgi:hypothetical protein